MRLRIGSLFSGYGGLDQAAQQVYGGELAWYADCCKFDKDGNAGHHEPHRAPCSIMARHHPDVPNLGDVTKVDWSQVEPVDILTGGSPCQDLSHAGRRAGMSEGTRSNLWVAMREAIATLRPSLVIWENVGGAASAEADSELEPCAGCVGDGSGVHLRALGRVVGDLASLGYDVRFHAVRAADVGAPHGRLRYFLAANPEGQRWAGCDKPWPNVEQDGSQPAHGGSPRRAGLTDGAATNEGVRRPAGRTTHAVFGVRSGDGDGPTASDSAQQLLPTPRATDGTKGGPGQRGSSGDLMLPSAVALLPTPAVNDMGEGKTVERWDEWTADMQAKHANGNGHGKSLAIEAQRLLQAPSVADALGGHESRSGARSDELLLNGQAKAMHGARWGDYAAAIARWEHALGRPAPEPTMTSAKGNPQLSPKFVEWLMGLPAGWVTDIPGITRNEALKALGNGVVPQQAAYALRVMASWERVAA